MKTLIKLIAVAAAFGLSPAAALAQDVLPAQPAQELVAESQADPAQPEEASPDQAAVNPEEPSDATVAASTYARQVVPEHGVGQPAGPMMLQAQFPPIGEEPAGFQPVILRPVNPDIF